MIVDADPSGNTCHKALFNIGGTTTTSRSWDIKITQYSCGDYDSSGYEFSTLFFTLLRISSKKFIDQKASGVNPQKLRIWIKIHNL